VQETLDGLARRDDPLIVKLERQAGQKEARYAHLLGGEVTQHVAAAPSARATSPASNDRIEKLEGDVEALRTELAEFRATFDEFRKQFD
jgi:hypothetical protein